LRYSTSSPLWHSRYGSYSSWLILRRSSTIFAVRHTCMRPECRWSPPLGSPTRRSQPLGTPTPLLWLRMQRRHGWYGVIACGCRRNHGLWLSRIVFAWESNMRYASASLRSSGVRSLPCSYRVHDSSIV
jgi:hypothetical protein